MIQIRPNAKIFLRPGKTDFRKSINGLGMLVKQQKKLDSYQGNYFVFCNQIRSLLKILYWDNNGFCLWQKCLEEDKFRRPRSEAEAREMMMEEFQWLMQGLISTTHIE